MGLWRYRRRRGGRQAGVVVVEGGILFPRELRPQRPTRPVEASGESDVVPAATPIPTGHSQGRFARSSTLFLLVFISACRFIPVSLFALDYESRIPDCFFRRDLSPS
jgi:hypothetical protein